MSKRISGSLMNLFDAINSSILHTHTYTHCIPYILYNIHFHLNIHMYMLNKFRNILYMTCGHKGRVSGMLCSIPVYAVLVENLGERGAHRTAFQEYLTLSEGKKKSASSTSGSAAGTLDSSPSLLTLTAGAILVIIGALVVGRSLK